MARRNPVPRKLNEDDVFSFNLSAQKRMPVRTRQDIMAHMERKNGWRWWRLKHDYKWLQREMRKLGYNPDEAKDLL